MAEQENLAMLQAVLKAFNENDIHTASQGLHPDAAYIIRGHASVSGTYRGREEIAAGLRRIKELTAGTITVVPEVVLAKGDAIMTYMRVTGSRPDGRQYDNHQAYLYRFRDGKIIEGQTIPVDQDAFKEFFAD